MIKIDVRVDISGALKKLDALEKQARYAQVVALTKTAQRVKADLAEEIDRVFDNPTPFTQNSLYVAPATKSRPLARVGLKDWAAKGTPAARYLAAQVFGGARHVKPFERLLQRAGILPSGWYAMPTKYAPKDPYGNVPGSLVVKILSQLQASRDPSQNETAKQKLRRNRDKKRMGGRYFAISPWDRGHLVPGIYERLTTGFGSAVRPIFVFTGKAPHYKQRLRFLELGEQRARVYFPIEFQKALAGALRTAR